MYSRQHIALPGQASPVAAPVASGPARALVEELEAVLEGGLNLALAIVLNPGLDLMADQPTSDEIVVVGIEDVAAPALSLEALQEVVALQNLGPVGSSPARHARGSAINVMGSGNLEVPPLDVGRAKPIEDAG